MGASFEQWQAGDQARAHAIMKTDTILKSMAGHIITRNRRCISSMSAWNTVRTAWAVGSAGTIASVVGTRGYKGARMQTTALTKMITRCAKLPPPCRLWT